MRKLILTICLFIFFSFSLSAQNSIKGIITNNDTQKPIQGVQVVVLSTPAASITNANGEFTITDLIDGKYLLQIKLVGYETQNFPIELIGKTIDLGTILMYKDVNEDLDLSLITITDDELNDDGNAADNIAGLLQATQDLFLRTAAFEFSSSFFSIRGLDSGNGKVLINGVEMNKLYDGRAQWANWGGLNDVLRNQEFSNAWSPSNYTFGGVLGATNIITRASQQRPGTRISYASSNRSYQHRVMATYSTGLREDGWAFTFSGSRRTALEGFQQGTTYDAYSIFTSIEKKFNDNHSLYFTGIFAPNRRGKSSPNTAEVNDIKGFRYNEYWGHLNGKKINSRIKEVVEPILMLNHDWILAEGITFTNSIAYQFGRIGNSRIDFNGGANPSPTYYQRLPSYFESDNDLAGAYDALQNFQNDGQLDWERFFDANITNANNSLTNAYVLYEDRTDDKQLIGTTILTAEISDNITLNSKLEGRLLKSDNFANVIDLLGGNGYLDINPFPTEDDKKQNNLLNRDRVVGVGDKFKYDYSLYTNNFNGFLQAQFKYNKVDFYGAVSLSTTKHQREGYYQNGRFTSNSLGLSEELSFTNYGLKGGVTYKITGRHLVDFNVGYLTQAPTIRNSFSNPRENNNPVRDLISEKLFSTDVSYIVRSPFITSRLTGYYTKIQDATEISFYFADGIDAGLNQNPSAFVQEVLSDIDKQHFGLEFGLEAKVTPTITLKGVAAVGQFTYTNNPNVYLTSDIINQGIFDINGRSANYTSNLKNYRIASGPQGAYSVGFEYRDPDYWWFGASTNLFTHTYADIAPLNRSSLFYSDPTDGLPFPDYDPVLAKDLLKQERFEDYYVVNLIGGKSWKIDDYYISLFATVNNLFNNEFRTGGYEQGRNANYRELRDDKALDTRVFGNKYWYGRGTTYFLNINVRF